MHVSYISHYISHHSPHNMCCVHDTSWLQVFCNTLVRLLVLVLARLQHSRRNRGTVYTLPSDRLRTASGKQLWVVRIKETLSLRARARGWVFGVYGGLSQKSRHAISELIFAHVLGITRGNRPALGS